MDRYPWFKSYDKDIPHSLAPYPEKTLLDCFDEAVSQRPGHPAVLFKGRKVSFRDMDRYADAVAAGLAACNVKKGDRVSLLMPNCPQMMFCHLGIWRIGAIVSPVNPLYTRTELEHAFQESGTEVVICLGPFYEKVKKLQPNTKIRLVIVADLKDFLPPLLRIAFTLVEEKKGGHRVDLRPGDLRLSGLLQRYRKAKRPDVEVQPSDLALLLFSGGTTGTTEAAVATHHALFISGMQLQTWFSPVLKAWDDMIMLTIPAFHVFGNVALMGTSIVYHLPLVMVPNPADIKDVLNTIKKTRPTFIPGVPTIFMAMLNHKMVKEGKVDFSCAKLFIVGGAPLRADLKSRFEELSGGRMVEGYALTESMLAGVITPATGKYKEGAVGLPLPDVIIRIVDAETGRREMPIGQSGEIIIKAPQIMQGYWQRPKETAEMIRDGWLYTGDIGCLDEDGYVYIQSRKKHVIKCGGFQVWPRQVEEVIGSHRAVKDVIVAGIPDPYQGEAVKAWVVLDGIPCTADELKKYCRERLTSYKVPRYIEFRNSLPRSAIGKPLARLLLDEELEKIKQRN